MKTYLHGPMDYAKTLKLRFRVGDQKEKYTSSRGEEEEDARMCPCGKAVEQNSHCRSEMHKDERYAFEEMKTIDEFDVEKFGKLDSSEKTIAIILYQEIDGGHRRRNGKGIIR